MAVNQDLLDLEQVVVDPSCAMLIPAEFAFEHRVLPLCMVDEDLVVVMADPSDVRTLSEIRRVHGMAVIGRAADPLQLDALLKKIYGGLQAALQSAQSDDAASTVDYLLRMAFMRHASDIHFDPDDQGIRVRFRVDGELVDVMRVSLERQMSVTSRLKVLGNMKLDERRAPQDGGFAWRVPDAFTGSVSSLDVRMATLPGLYGEKVTLRLLETDSKRFSIGSLGMVGADQDAFESVLGFPHGLLLLTGPTGSGKTTTLYAAIQHLLTLRPMNIITVENPVEYEIPGIFQSQVDWVDKVNFTKALRSILRHDPDVIMIGEIRDGESLDTAVKAALTGHLVLSTLHTNDAVSSVTRLANMGLERHLVAATLRLAVSQRLVRALCPCCRAPIAMTEKDAALMGRPTAVGTQVFAPHGCVYCAGRGLRGRMGLFEMFRPDGDVGAAISDGAHEMEIRKLARSKGCRSLLDDGWEKCLSGLTTVSEVARVAYCS